MTLFQFLHGSFSCCLHCGSFRIRPSQFCFSCEEALWNIHPQLTQFPIAESPDHGFALFSWYPDQDRRVSKLMMALKGGDIEEAFQFYAGRMVSQLPSQHLPKNAVLVPCPNHPNRKHAHQLAKAFEKVLGIPAVDCLTKGSSFKEQKSMPRHERNAVEMVSHEELEDCHVIFIDDIVTTGSTARSARKALPLIEGFEVWCLAHRRQLARTLEI